MLRRTTPQARAARRGCATPCHLCASMPVRPSAPLAACPKVCVKAHSRGPARSGSTEYSPSSLQTMPWVPAAHVGLAALQACMAHLHVGRRQQWRRTGRRCRAARCQRRGGLSRVCQPRHRPPCGCPSVPLLRRLRRARAQRATAQAQPHAQSGPARRPRRRRRAPAPDASPGWPEQAHSSALPRALVQRWARLLGARHPRAGLRLPRWCARAPQSRLARPCHEVHARCSGSRVIMGMGSRLWTKSAFCRPAADWPQQATLPHRFTLLC